MELKLEMMQPYRIAYIRTTGPYGANNMHTMEELKNWARQNGLLNDSAILLGIALDNPETTESEHCRYDTCIVVAENYDITDCHINDRKQAGGNYAVFTIEHTAEAILKAWVDIFPALLMNGYQMDGTRPILERYAMQMVNRHLCEICVPVC